jgi:hypothetical protein
MKKLFLALAILTLLAIPGRIRAQEPNKFGIHILDTDEINQAAGLVNSKEGDWGWVTIVLRINDLDQKKWQGFFDDCRRLHIIPLVRLATEIENNFWRKPTTADIDQISSFLSSLNWPTKDQYIIVFNEPNHAKEWGGEINPIEYAQVLSYTANKFKEANKNFIILNAGFDLAANNSKETMDVYRYWQIMNQTIPNIFNCLDAWSSHSYPNPGFVGKPTDQGRQSVTGYRWEINTLKNNFGITKNWPIFITETGWPHQDNSKPKVQNSKLSGFLDSETVAEYTQSAFSIWLADQQVQAITPFVLNYHAAPLDAFSWLSQDGQDYPHCRVVRELPKTAWWPEQIESWETENIDLPKFLPINSRYQGKITLKNTGQSIWGEKNFTLVSLSDFADNLILPPGVKVEPGESCQFVFNITASKWPKTANLSWEELEGETAISFFNPSRLDSYQNNFWQKIIALIKVWWYRKIPHQKLGSDLQENYPQN